MAVYIYIFFFTSRLLFTNDALHCAQSSSRYVSHSHEFHLNVTSVNSKELLLYSYTWVYEGSREIAMYHHFFLFFKFSVLYRNYITNN